MEAIYDDINLPINRMTKEEIDCTIGLCTATVNHSKHSKIYDQSKFNSLNANETADVNGICYL